MKHFKAGQYISQGYYKSFQPTFINRQWQVESMEVLQLLSQADRELGQLDMYSNYIPNIDLFISMHVLKEATQSSKIEGTQTNIEEALLDKKDVPLDKRDDWDEVQNYITALETAIKALENLPFSSRLIRDTHKVLMQGVRGEKKQPGEFRNSQNWIGGATINDALYIPPVHLLVPDLMNAREKNDITQWFKFFLVGIIKTAKKGISTFDSILQLQKQNNLKIQRLGSRAANAQKITNYLYQRPMINAEKVSEVLGLSLPSSYKLIGELEKMEILKEITGGQRGRIYVFDNYLKLFK
jgi:Fic family protein